MELQLPKLGESIVSARIVQWLKNEGDRIEKDEPLLEVSTDKVNSEIPSPISGILEKKLIEEDEEVDVGEPIAKIAPDKELPLKENKKLPLSNEEIEKDNQKFFSPRVLSLAQRHNIPLDKLEKISGSGHGGRVTKKDLESFFNKSNLQTEETPKESSKSCNFSDVEKMKMTNMRKAIADNMVRSFYEAPHASLIMEVDVTNLMKKIANEKADFMKAHGVKLTITSFLLKALGRAALKYPMINATLEKDTIIMKRFVNIGIAVSVENGVFVPVLKDCHLIEIPEIAKELTLLSKNARENNLSSNDMNAGTITLTNFGMTGALIGIPIIKHPEVAIIGIGTVQKNVKVINDNQFGIRETFHATLTFDHRIIDGIYGANFLKFFKNLIEQIA